MTPQVLRTRWNSHVVERYRYSAAPRFCYQHCEMHILTTCMHIQRHKFTTSFTLEGMRDTLLWRVEHLRPWSQTPPFPRGLLICLQPPASDFLGQPVVVMRPSVLQSQTLATETMQDYVIHALEMLRKHLAQFNSNTSTRPKLQALIVLDMTDISVRTVVRFIYSLGSDRDNEYHSPEY